MKNIKFNTYFTTGILVSSIFLLSGCCNCDLPRLTAHNWVLEKYGPESAPVNVIPGASPEIMLILDNNNRFSGNDGCNQFNGKYYCISKISLTNEKCNIQFDSMISTAIACLDPNINKQATAIQDLLQKAGIYEVSDVSLVLRTGDKQVLIYRKQ